MEGMGWIKVFLLERGRETARFGVAEGVSPTGDGGHGDAVAEDVGDPGLG